MRLVNSSPGVRPMGENRAPSNMPGSFFAACGFGIALEMLTWFLNKLVGILPEPYTHFLWIRGDTNWNVYYNRAVLKECLEFSSIVLVSLVGIWFCSGRTNGLQNSQRCPSWQLKCLFARAQSVNTTFPN
jgi:hypothetical protein